MVLIERAKAYPPVAHLLRATDRFTSRLGNQSAAAIAYFSVLLMVPILMFAFAILGITLTVIRPDLLDLVYGQIAEILPPGDVSEQVKGLISTALQNWSTVGLVGLATGMWAGSLWARNLKSAVRAQVRESYDAGERRRFIVLETLSNVGILIVLFAGLLLTFAMSSAATTLSGLVSQYLGLVDAGSRVLVTLATIAASLFVGFLLFLFMLTALPDRKLPIRTVVQGAAIGSVGLAGLQVMASLLVGILAANPAAALFGPVIVLMLLLNMIATLVLMIAAWIATARPAVEAPGLEVFHPEPLDALPVARPPVDPALQRGFRIGAVVGSAAGAAAGALMALTLSRRRVRVALRASRPRV